MYLNIYFTHEKSIIYFQFHPSSSECHAFILFQHDTYSVEKFLEKSAIAII